MDGSIGRHLESHDYQDLAKELAPQIVDLINMAKKGECAPPFELYIADESDDLVFHAQVDIDGKMMRLMEDKPLHARYPLTIRLTEQGGREWEARVGAPSIQ